ncbi:MAG: hypothetical protein OXG74_08920 [Acidobacteria bacterium]|nr:hypothetical protein [Acidobacteriota bacterium]
MTDLRRELLRGLSAVDRRLRLRRALAALVWLVPASCLWLLSTWLLRMAAGAESSAAALWPSWAGGIVLVALVLREAASLGRDLPASARAVDKAGDLRDAVATALEMQRRADTDSGRPTPEAEAVWPLPWIALVLERGVAGLDRTGARRAAPRLVPRGAAASAILSVVLLVPVVLPTSFVGEALAAAMSADGADNAAPGLEAAALLEEEPGRRPGVPEFDVRLSDLPFLTLRIREPDSEDARRNAGDASDAVEGSLGDGADAEAMEGNPEGGEAAAADFAGEQNAETGADLMRELDTGDGAGEEEAGAPGMPGEGEGAEAAAESAAGEGAGGQPTEEGEGAGSETGTAAAVSEEPGAAGAEADGAAAGVGTGPQEEMVDPFGDLLMPALSLEQALETALLQSQDEIERRPLTTTSATQFRAAEVAMRGSSANVGGGAEAATGELPPPRHPIAWRHRASVRRYLESLEHPRPEDESREERQ